jgi:hypothetical protein
MNPPVVYIKIYIDIYNKKTDIKTYRSYSIKGEKGKRLFATGEEK